MKTAYIVKAYRTAVGKAPKGVFRFKRPDELAAETIQFMLNELPEFGGINPSLERFVKLLWDRLSASLPPGISCAVRLWENTSAWAGYEEPLQGRG